MLSIKRLLARRLCVPLPSHLELCLLFPPSPPSTDTDTDTAEMTVVVLDDALTLKDVVVEVWGKGADVSEELVLHYFLRGPGVAGLWGLENGIESGS